MLKIIRSIKELDFGQLMAVYAESNQVSGRQRYPYLSENEQLLRAEQDFYTYLLDFFRQPDAFCAVWAEDGVCVAALRIERYSDGYLLAGLETAPAARNKGNAVRLINAVLAFLTQQGSVKVYSHVEKKNAASMAVHASCGFDRILEHAIYIDGSVLHTSCTFCFEI